MGGRGATAFPSPHQESDSHHLGHVLVSSHEALGPAHGQWMWVREGGERHGVGLHGSSDMGALLVWTFTGAKSRGG